MAQTLLFQEKFDTQGVGAVVTSGDTLSAGVLNATGRTMHVYPFGPKTAGDTGNGWSLVFGDGSAGVNNVRNSLSVNADICIVTTLNSVDNDIPHGVDAARMKGACSVWVYVGSIPDSVGNVVELIQLQFWTYAYCRGLRITQQTGEPPYLTKADGVTKLCKYPRNKWLYVAMAWENTASVMTVKTYYKFAGDADVTLAETQTFGNIGLLHTQVGLSRITNYNFGVQDFRIALPRLFSLGALAEYTYTDIDPIENNIDFYIDPVDGDDANTGTTVSTAIKTTTEFQTRALIGALPGFTAEELSVSGIVVSGSTGTVTTSTNHKYVIGQTIGITGCNEDGVDGLYIVISTPLATTFTISLKGLRRYSSSGVAYRDTIPTSITGTIKCGLAGGGVQVKLISTTPVVIPSTGLVLYTNGVKLLPYTPGTTSSFVIFSTYTSGDFTSIGNGVYRISHAYANSVVWQGSQRLTPVTGANWVAAQATVEATAGKSYSDGTNLYINPFGGTFISVEVSRTYTSSYAVRAMCNGFLLKDFDIHGYQNINSTTGAIVPTYPFAIGNDSLAYSQYDIQRSFYGRVYMGMWDCEVYRGGTHSIGLLAADGSYTFFLEDCSYGLDTSASTGTVTYACGVGIQHYQRDCDYLGGGGVHLAHASTDPGGAKFVQVLSFAGGDYLLGQVGDHGVDPACFNAKIVGGRAASVHFSAATSIVVNKCKLTSDATLTSNTVTVVIKGQYTVVDNSTTITISSNSPDEYRLWGPISDPASPNGY
jgi:hypothetical protein